MSEQEFLGKCKSLFPGIEEGDHKVPVSNLSNEGMLLGPGVKMRADLAKDLGFPPSGSIILDNARTAKACGDAYSREDERKLVNSTIAGAEKKLAEAIMKGESEVKILDVGRGISHLQDAYFEAPKLEGAHKQIYEGLQKIPFLKTELKADPNKKSEYHIAVSIKGK